MTLSRAGEDDSFLVCHARARVATQSRSHGTENDIRNLGVPVIRFSSKVWSELRQIRTFLFANMYRAPSVMEQRAKVTRVVQDLFPYYMDHPDEMPDRWSEDPAATGDRSMTARLVADYISGMTDRYALQKHEKLIAD